MDQRRPTDVEGIRDWCETDESLLYEEVKGGILAKREGKTWAAGNVRM